MDRRRSVASCIAMATSWGAPGRGYQVVSTEGNRVGKAPQYTFHLEGVPSAVCGAFRQETRPWRWVAAVEPPLQMVTPRARSSHPTGSPWRAYARAGRVRLFSFPIDPPLFTRDDTWCSGTHASTSHSGSTTVPVHVAVRNLQSKLAALQQVLQVLQHALRSEGDLPTEGGLPTEALQVLQVRQVGHSGGPLSVPGREADG